MISLLFLLVLNFSFGEIRNCQGKRNNYTIYDEEPTFIRQVENAKLYTVGDPEKESNWYIAHLYGSNDYEMGVAYGKLMPDEISSFISFFYTYIDDYVDKHFESLPKWLKDWIETHGVDFVLDFFYTIAMDYTPDYFFDFIKGISEGAGIDYKKYRRTMLVTQALMMSVCTVFGATGDATQSGDLIHLRSLDFSNEGEIIPLIYIPTIAVHHYEDDDSSTVINIASAGYVGSITGSSEVLSFGSKEWINTEHSTLPIPGFVANFHSFHILRYGKNLESAIRVARDAKRTLASFAGIASRHENKFLGVEYSPENITVFDWKNQSEYECHPKLKDVVYWDRHSQPSKDYCFGDLLKEYHGKYTAELIIRDIAPLIRTGDASSTLWDYKDFQLYTSWGKGTTLACDKQYVKIDLQKIFDEKKP